jgi:hemerythrin
MKWSDDYATGIQRIDDQHKWIFRVADDFRSALEEGQGEKTYGVLLGFLEGYVRAHFGFEERCMEEYHCPAARANRQAHAEFTDTLDDFSRRYAGGGYRDQDAREMVDTLERWFLSHIAHVDVRLRESVVRPG